MSINTRTGRTDTSVRADNASRLVEIRDTSPATTVIPALVNALESVIDYVDRCEESGITMQPGDIRRLVAAALGGAS